MKDLTLSRPLYNLLVFLSFVLVALGQPAWIPALGVPAAIFGFALFWRAMLSLPLKKQRFWLSFLWFSSVQLFQLSWFLSHPFYYIVAVWLFLSLAMGMQFGILSLLFDPDKMSRAPRLFAIAACWTLMEWGRLFFLSGSSWNPVGLSLAGNLFSLQAASLAGVFGLSFLVIITNLFALRMWLNNFKIRSRLHLAAFALFPYLFGIAAFAYHSAAERKFSDSQESQFHALLVQTAFPVEETLTFKSRSQYLEFVMEEWKKIIGLIKEHRGKPVDLIAIPELVVPFGTYTFIYPLDEVKSLFEEAFGKEAMEKLPPLELPLAVQLQGEDGKPWMVSNAFFSQAISNLFEAGLVIGLEDAEDVEGSREYYSSAVYFLPESHRETGEFSALRYAKRVLVPMGEYIPFSFCRELAAKYGVFGSFTCGKHAEVWKCGKTPFGVSICYEEMFGEMMRENRQKGADFLLNISSDAWFPHSKLIRQHLEHSRLRTVENGFPLVRACNTGISCVVDSLGRDAAVLGENDKEREDLSLALYAPISLYNYQTLYSRFGDWLIVGLSIAFLLAFLKFR